MKRRENEWKEKEKMREQRFVLMEIFLSSARSLAVLLMWGPERQRDGQTDRQTDRVDFVRPYRHFGKRRKYRKN